MLGVGDDDGDVLPLVAFDDGVTAAVGVAPVAVASTVLVVRGADDTRGVIMPAHGYDSLGSLPRQSKGNKH